MESPTLAELQQGLATWVLDGRDVGLERWVSVPSGVDVDARLAVYSGGYPARLREALVETYPSVAKILGDGSFASLLERYRRVVPTGWLNLNYVGRSLPNFLLSDRLIAKLPFLPDLARFEWRVFECFHARVAKPFDLSTLTNWELSDWSNAQISFQPGVGLVSSRWPIHDLRAARDHERSEIDIDLTGRPQSVWIYREGFEVKTEPLDKVEADIARRLLEGMTLGDVMLQTEITGPDASRVLDLFARFTTWGLVRAIG